MPSPGFADKMDPALIAQGTKEPVDLESREEGQNLMKIFQIPLPGLLQMLDQRFLVGLAFTLL
jgi:hypothetical protein